MRAIARLLGFQTQHTVQPVQPTPIAGPAPQELIQQFGKVPSVQDTDPQRQLSLAQPRSQKKQKAVKQTTVVSKGTSKKQKPAQTGKSQSTRGSSTPTPASKTRQHAKQAAKPKR
jgi:hypothetical protein